MNKRNTRLPVPAAPSRSLPLRRIKLTLDRVSLRELAHTDLATVAGGTISAVNTLPNVPNGCYEVMM